MALHTMGGVASIINKLESNSLETCFDRVIPDNDPSPSNPISVYDFIQNAILLDTVVNSSAAGNSGGTYTISGYQGAPSGAQSLGTSNHMKYINMGAGSQGNITITATATYPHYVAGFYTATGGGGTQLVAGSSSTTTLTLTQTSTSPSVNNIWVHFGSGTPTLNAVNLSFGSTSAVACEPGTTTFYTSGTSNTFDENHLYSNSSGTTDATSGRWYSNGIKAAYYNGNGNWSGHSFCSF